jgi:hypothetical protein
MPQNLLQIFSASEQMESFDNAVKFVEIAKSRVSVVGRSADNTTVIAV